jgi:hypothetical protein
MHAINKVSTDDVVSVALLPLRSCSRNRARRYYYRSVPLHIYAKLRYFFYCKDYRTGNEIDTAVASAMIHVGTA